LRRCDGILVIHGHPHSLTGPGVQNERWLVPMLQLIVRLRSAGLVRICLPRELVCA
jgi:hypothetical protein